MSPTPVCPVVHFEMPVHDRERAARFYQAAFGWSAQMLGAEMGHYTVMTTAVADAIPDGHRGAINGGLFLQNAGAPIQHPSVVIGVPDVRAAMARVREAGGQLLSEPMMIPGVGDFVSFTDTEGNRHSMLQALPRSSTSP